MNANAGRKRGGAVGCVLSVLCWVFVSGCSPHSIRFTPSPTIATMDAFLPDPTSTATSSLPPTVTASPTATASPTVTPTLTPTFTPTPDPRRLVVAFVSDWSGDDDVYLLDPATGNVVNLTHAPGEDRDPVFSPDGRSLLFRSNASGSWAFYGIDLQTGERVPLPDDDLTTTAYRGNLAPGTQADYRYAYESYRDGYLRIYVCNRDGVHHPLTSKSPGDYGPAWRPGTSEIVFASWRKGRKGLYMVDADGGEPVCLTKDAADEEDPAWHPDGRRLAFVRWQDYDADLYELDVSRGRVRRLTDNPYPDRSPAFAPDGTLFWTRYVPGEPFELHNPFYPGHWHLWMRSPGGSEQQVSLPIIDMDVYTPAAGFALWPLFVLSELTSPTPTPMIAPGERVELVRLDIECAGGDPRINALLVDDYEAWRKAVLAQSGYDFLGQISDMFRPLGYGTRNYAHLSWHRTGRALDFLFEWRDPPAGPNQLVVARENLGPQTYWRLFLRCRDQDGTMGQPITVAPWIFWFELDRAQEPGAFAAGGKPGAPPAGYYVDLTRLAKRYGWHRIASYEEPDFNWKTDSVGREFWHYEKTEGLTWWQAMGQIYPLQTLEALYGWKVCSEELEMDPLWLQAKGIPTPTAVDPSMP